MVEDRISKLVLDPFKGVSACNEHSYFILLINIFHDLMQSGWNDPIAVDPGTAQQQVVGSFNVNDITPYFHLQVADLALELNFSQWMGLTGVT